MNFKYLKLSQRVFSTFFVLHLQCHIISPCLWIIVFVCVFLVKSFLQHFISEWFTAHLQSLYSIMQVPYVSECPWEGLGNIRHLREWGTSSEGGGNNLPYGVHYSEFLDLFPVWGEHSANHDWLCTGEDVRQVCGHRPLLHQSTMGLAQEWTPLR